MEDMTDEEFSLYVKMTSACYWDQIDRESLEESEEDSECLY